MSCRHNAILASGSSERYEIDVGAIEDLAKRPAGEHVKRAKDFPLTTFECKHGVSVRLLCDGEPINFGLSSGIPKPAIEPVLMQLLWGAVALSAGKFQGRKGIIPFSRKAEQEIIDICKRLG